jgi:hypothetical protein
VLRSALFAPLALIALARNLGGCGVDSKSGGVNAPCTRAKDCNENLVCQGGACIDLDASTGDGGGGDASDTGLSDAAPGG